MLLREAMMYGSAAVEVGAEHQTESAVEHEPETGMVQVPGSVLQRLLQCELALLELVRLRRLKQAGDVKSYKVGKAYAWEEAYRLADSAEQNGGDVENP